MTTIPVEKLRTDRIAIFISVTPMTLATYRRFIVLFLEKLMDVLMQQGEMRNGEHDVMLMLDEFGNAGEIDTLLTMMPLMRKYGLRVVPIVQDTAQIERIMSARAARYFGPAPHLRFISTSLQPGTQNTSRTSLAPRPSSRNQTAIPISTAPATASQRSQPIAKQVLPVTYLQSMPDHKAILRVAGYPVFQVTKIEGYQDPRFAALKLHAPVRPPQVKVVKIERYRAQHRGDTEWTDDLYLGPEEPESRLRVAETPKAGQADRHGQNDHVDGLPHPSASP